MDALCVPCQREPDFAPRPALALLDTTTAVETPERVRFRFRLAGPGRRSVAWAIDLVIRLALILGVGIVVVLFAAVPVDLTRGGAVGLFLVFVFVLEWFYGVFFETLMAGRTPGKLAVSIRVVRGDGSPARFPDYVLRNLLRGVDYLPALPLGPTALYLPLFGVALVAMLLDDRHRRLGDMVAGTVVIIEDRSALASEVRIDPPVTEDERLALPARVDLEPEELRMIEEFLRRRRRLSDERAEELAQVYGKALSERTGVQAPTWERVLTLAYARATGKDR